jgi:hypothetical protein
MIKLELTERQRNVLGNCVFEQLTEVNSLINRLAGNNQQMLKSLMDREKDLIDLTVLLATAEAHDGA